MSVNDIFMQASRQNLTFKTTRGRLPVNDLWHLDLKATLASVSNNEPNLNDLAAALDARLEAAPRKNFVDDEDQIDVSTDRLRFDIIMAIITVKKAERDQAQNLHKNQETARKLDALIARKQDSALEEKDIDELRQMRASLNV